MVEKFKDDSVNGPLYRGRLSFEGSLFKAYGIPVIREKVQGASRIIEVGCGQGDKLKAIGNCTSANIELGGIDSSEKMLEGARAKYPELAVNLRLDEALNPTTLDGEYDMILFLKVLQYFSQEEIEACLKQYMAHLSEEGVIVLLNRFVSENGFKQKWDKFLLRLYAKIMGFNPSDYRNLKFSELDEVILETGLKIQRRVKIPISGELIILGR
jgi:ubiquinone/menaquinone biosynthesis C-methylase UbiE